MSLLSDKGHAVSSNGRRKLLLLGGNRSNQLSIRQARQHGYFTIVVDPRIETARLSDVDMPLPLDVRDCQQLLKVIDEIDGIDGIVCMSEVGIEAAVSLCSTLGLPSISASAAANARSKAAMRALWACTGFSVEFEVVNSEAEAEAAVRKLGFPLIFKPDRSFGGSRGVSSVETKDQIADAFAFAVQMGLPGSSVVIERRVTGTEHSCEVLIHEGATSVLCIGQKVKTPAPYRVDRSVEYPASLLRQQKESVSRMCSAAVAALGLTRGAAHVEFANTADGPVLFEIGARCGGGHTPVIAHAVSGVDEMITVCRMACGEPVGNLAPVSARGADYRFVFFPPGQVCDVFVPDAVRNHPGILDADILVKAREDIHSTQTTSDRSGFVVTHAETREEAVQLADWAVRQMIVTYTNGHQACGFLFNDSGETAR